MTVRRRGRHPTGTSRFQPPAASTGAASLNHPNTTGDAIVKAGEDRNRRLDSVFEKGSDVRRGVTRYDNPNGGGTITADNSATHVFSSQGGGQAISTPSETYNPNTDPDAPEHNFTEAKPHDYNKK